MWGEGVAWEGVARVAEARMSLRHLAALQRQLVPDHIVRPRSKRSCFSIISSPAATPCLPSALRAAAWRWYAFRYDGQRTAASIASSRAA